jgi:hypothetical protein
MAATKTVKARWVASYKAELPDGTELVPGETVVEGLPRAEAEDSDNWELVGGSKKKDDD